MTSAKVTPSSPPSPDAPDRPLVPVSSNRSHRIAILPPLEIEQEVPRSGIKQELLAILDNCTATFLDREISDEQEVVAIRETSAYLIEMLRLVNELLDKNRAGFQHADRLLRAPSMGPAQASRDVTLSFLVHELRGPILNILELFNMRPTDDFQSTVELCFKSLQALIRDLPDAADGPIPLHLSPIAFKITELGPRVIKQIGGLAASRGIRIGFAKRGFPRTVVKGDRRRIEQILVNLMKNAIEFSPDHEQIDVLIRTEEENDDHFLLKFSVRDRGPGIAPEIQKHLFSPFSQGAQEHRKAGKTSGLGLAFCRDLAVALNGGAQRPVIGVESQLGEGSLFWFVVPLQKQAEETPLPRSPRQPPPSIMFAKRDIRILVAEDILVTQKVIGCILKRAGCSSFEFALDGELAYNLFLEKNFDVIILDLHMPKLAGWEVVQRIHDSRRKMPFLIISSANTQEIIEQELSMKGIAHLVTIMPKPLVYHTLVSSVNGRVPGELAIC